MACEFARHAHKAFEVSGTAIRPQNIAHRLKSVAKHFQLGRQEDAHEYLRYVIDHMWKSCVTNYEKQHPGMKLDPSSKETTVINDIFGGYHRSEVVCLECKETSNTFDYFMDFMLDIKNVSTLQKALEKFTHTEILHQENAYKCQKCKKKCQAKKRFTVHRAPNVATFQLKRFDYNRMFGGKITKFVQYPETLNMRPYMSESTGPAIIYKLFGVLVHLGGSCNSGHYYCYVRNSNGTWFNMDDARVTSVGLNTVLNQNAYILFYVKKQIAKEYISKPISQQSMLEAQKPKSGPKLALNGNGSFLVDNVPLANKPVPSSPDKNKPVSKLDQVQNGSLSSTDKAVCVKPQLTNDTQNLPSSKLVLTKKEENGLANKLVVSKSQHCPAEVQTNEATNQDQPRNGVPKAEKLEQPSTYEPQGTSLHSFGSKGILSRSLNEH